MVMKMSLLRDWKLGVITRLFHTTRMVIVVLLLNIQERLTMNKQCEQCSYYNNDFTKHIKTQCVSVSLCPYYINYQKIMEKKYGYAKQKYK